MSAKALNRVLIVGLLVAIPVLALAVAATFGLLPGALALIAPFAIWYTALTRIEEARQAHERALELSKAKVGPATRPAIPTRPPLDEGGTVGQAPWAPGSGYGAA